MKDFLKRPVVDVHKPPSYDFLETFWAINHCPSSTRGVRVSPNKIDEIVADNFPSGPPELLKLIFVVGVEDGDPEVAPPSGWNLLSPPEQGCAVAKGVRRDFMSAEKSKKWRLVLQNIIVRAENTCPIGVTGPWTSARRS